MLGKARTGSGKTLGFGLPAISRLADGPAPEARKPRAIVLVPTRELAMQVNDALEPFAHAMQVSLRLVAGGLSMTKQVQALNRGVHLVVATPGRLADLVRRGNADMSDVDLVVLDEADHMADMGFMDEINEILEHVPSGGQRLLFSATLDGDVDRLVAEHMSDPVLHDVTDGAAAQVDMTHVVLSIPPHLKYQTAHRIVARDGRTIVFVRTKLACDRIATQMRDAGILAVALHGDKTQNERNAAITGFRSGQIPVLVATDVAARGIHVDAVDLVLQMDPPADHKDYTHRAGRTARAGSAGLVVTLSLPHQRRTIDRLIENAGVDATFRKIKDDGDESLAMLESLTGAQEPSGERVKLPRLAPAERERGGRDKRGRDNRSGGGRGRGPRVAGQRRDPRDRDDDRAYGHDDRSTARGDRRPARDDRDAARGEHKERPAERQRDDRASASRSQHRSQGDRPQRGGKGAKPPRKGANARARDNDWAGDASRGRGDSRKAGSSRDGGQSRGRNASTDRREANSWDSSRKRDDSRGRSETSGQKLTSREREAARRQRGRDEVDPRDRRGPKKPGRTSAPRDDTARGAGAKPSRKPQDNGSASHGDSAGSAAPRGEWPKSSPDGKKRKKSSKASGRSGKPRPKNKSQAKSKKKR